MQDNNSIIEIMMTDTVLLKQHPGLKDLLSLWTNGMRADTIEWLQSPEMMALSDTKKLSTLWGVMGRDLWDWNVDGYSDDTAYMSKRAWEILFEIMPETYGLEMTDPYVLDNMYFAQMTSFYEHRDSKIYFDIDKLSMVFKTRTPRSLH